MIALLLRADSTFVRLDMRGYSELPAVLEEAPQQKVQLVSDTGVPQPHPDARKYQLWLKLDGQAELSGIYQEFEEKGPCLTTEP